jgi:hypothetical protein
VAISLASSAGSYSVEFSVFESSALISSVGAFSAGGFSVGAYSVESLFGSSGTLVSFYSSFSYIRVDSDC